MPIYLQYGGYAHDPSDAEVMISREGVTSELGIVYAVRERWNINGRLHANDLPGINAAVESLYEAYSHDRQDIELVGSSHVMRSHDTINGTRVAMPPSFPKGNGAENSTFRSYTLAVEGEFAFSGDGILLSWAETLSFRGVGGPKWGLLETLNGQWPLQQFTDMSAMFCTQRGSAIIAPASAQRNDYGEYWLPPYPIFPQWEHSDKRDISFEQPADLYGKRVTHWSYDFEFNVPLLGRGFPNSDGVVCHLG